jgi:hypothetical protein
VAAALGDGRRLEAVRHAALAARHRHTFDAHVDRLVEVFASVT